MLLSRPMRARRLLLLAAFGLLLAACDSERGVRIVAITATPTSGTSAGGTAPLAGSATPPPVELPPRPDNPFAGGVSVSEYLAGGLAKIAECLPELVNAWELSAIEGPRCAGADIDGDGLDEFVFLVTTADATNPPGEAWFFDDSAAHYRFFSSARALANSVLSALEIAGVGDLTGDGRPEVIFVTRSCETECTTSIVIASQHRGLLEDLGPDDSALAGVEGVTVEDDNGDGLPDVLMRRNATAAPGPGPQRGLARRLAWSGVRFTVIDDEDPPEFLIHVIEDADSAMRVGNVAQARALYEQAATDTRLRDWKQEIGEFVGRRELVPFALFRAALAAARLGDGAGATALLARAASEGSNSMHGVAAAVYLSALETGSPASQACADAQRYLQPFAQAYQRFWDYGYSNPEHTIADLCP
ncbi:MAG: hypothetical protein O3B31_14235 [Chloroflexi bacterium]|nr:hypothetical protein [Chloroflexota bacterium]